MISDDSIGDRESEAAATTDCATAPHEAAHHARNLLFGNTGAAIDDVNRDATAGFACTYTKKMPDVRVADCVIDKIVQQKHHRRTIRTNRWKCWWNFDLDFKMAVAKLIAKFVLYLIDNRRHLDWPELICLGDVRDARVSEHVVYQPHQSLCFLNDDLCVITRGFVA